MPDQPVATAACPRCGAIYDGRTVVCGICDPHATRVPSDDEDGPFIVTVFVKCPECGKDFLAMADEEVIGCAQHGS